jgi:L-lactate dehydrogenase complex protein LldG
MGDAPETRGRAMSAGRAAILAAVKGALAAAVLPETARPADDTPPAERLRKHNANVIPARGQLGAKARVDLFIREAERVNATVARVSGMNAVPREVAHFLSKHNLPTQLKIAPSLAEPNVPWTSQTLLTVAAGPAVESDAVGVGRAFAGVAETGTLVLLSGPDNPTTLNFLPPTNLVVIRAAEIAGDYETVWARVRREHADADNGFMPRAVNFITGPSRTADIEQTLLLGAHGPQRLHIVIVDEQE